MNKTWLDYLNSWYTQIKLNSFSVHSSGSICQLQFLLRFAFFIKVPRCKHILTDSNVLITSSYSQQEAISQKEIVFRFRISLTKAGVLISCAWEVPGWGGGGSCANAPLYAALIRSVARAWGRCSTEPIVKEKGPMNLSCLRMYQILQSTHFRIVARGGGSIPLYQLFRYARVWFLWGENLPIFVTIIKSQQLAVK